VAKERTGDEGWLRKRTFTFVGLLCFVFAFFVWEALAGARILNPLTFPLPSRIFSEFIFHFSDGEMPLQVAQTFYRMAIGYALAIATAIPLGILMGYTKFFYNLLEPVIEFLRPLPPPAIIPILMVLMGTGDDMKIVVIFFGCFFPIMVNTLDGVLSTDPVLVNTARTYQMSTGGIMRKIILPSTSPYILSGMRVALPMSLIMAITAEILGGGRNGIGFFINWNYQSFDYTAMFAGIILIGIVGYILNLIFKVVENKYMAWNLGFRATEAGV